MQGAQQLSHEVLKSRQLLTVICSIGLLPTCQFLLDPDVVQQSPDMTAQLNGRKERLSWLVGFINENAALMKVSNK
jgi:nuclear pore complex protein Nup133